MNQVDHQVVEAFLVEADSPEEAAEAVHDDKKQKIPKNLDVDKQVTLDI